jgi:preprotein translocase subunit SecA
MGVNEVIDKVFGTYSDREVKRMLPIVEKIESLDEAIQKLSDEDLKNKTIEFKERLKNGETLDNLLVEAFAVVREAAYRVLGLKHYRVQLIGGIVLHQGRIAEMKTGEGKTLVATLPSYLNALEGKGVHIVTVNDYLAKRDRDEMGKVHEFLGLTTGVILHEQKPDERREQYKCDITYGINSEFGFDYLRDNMVMSKEERVQRELNYVIVDEVDSIFIDEARTPLIISGAGKNPSELYKVADYFAKTLKEGEEEDFTIDEKTKGIMLTEKGIDKAEEFYKIENYAALENIHIQHHTFEALKANYIMKNHVDYLVVNGEVMIVDTFTGRVMEGRRFSEGLHEAIEAKEGVKIKEESTTLATITYQNFFRLYKKLSGMTGTIVTEEKEIREIYNIDVVVIPTNRPIARIDREDLIYKTELAKFKAVVEDIAETQAKGQPVLVGTVSIEKSELVSMMLKRKGIPHQVLNAKHHAKEAEIVAKAGGIGAVTIATNMAGRGTDIKLGEGAVEAGGLKIIGTERHESQRIDNQLRGRSGRQGDVGESIFYVSLEDEIIRRFARERADKLEGDLRLIEGEAIDKKKVKQIVKVAQENIEADNFQTRKNLIQYDDVVNEQRKIIYKERNVVIDSDGLKEHVLSMFKDVICKEVDNHIAKKFKREELEALVHFFKDLYIGTKEINIEELIGLKVEILKEKFYSIAEDIYIEKEQQAGELWNIVEKNILIKIIDDKWITHMEDMDNLKKYIGYYGYNQKDPVTMYKLQGSELFEQTIYEIKKETVRFISHASVTINISASQ